MNRYTKILIILSFLSFSLSTFAQQVDWSTFQRIGKDIERVNIVGKNNQGYFVFFDGDDEKFVIQYDEELDMEHKHVIQLQPSHARIEKLIVTFNEVVLFYSFQNENKHRIYRFKTLSFGKNQPIIQKQLFTVPPRKQSNRLFVTQSSDYKHILCYTYAPIANDEANYNIKSVVINATLDSIQKRDIAFSFSPENTDFKYFAIDQASNFHFLIVTKNKDAERDDPKRLQYKAISYLADEEQLYSFPIQMTDYLVEDIQLKVDNANQNLVITGFYSEKTYQKISGVFYNRIDITSKKMQVAETQSFPTDFIDKIFAEQVEKKRKRDSDYLLRKVVLRSDGGIVITGETYFTTVVSYSSPNFYSTYSRQQTTYYHYDDAIVVSIHPDGKIHWSQLVKKRQVTENENSPYASFAISSAGRKINLVFNDDLSRQGNVMQYALNTKGEMDRESLFKGVVLIRWGKQVARNELIFPKIERKSFRLVRITY